MAALYCYIFCLNKFSFSYYTLAILLLALSAETRSIALYLIPISFIPFLFKKIKLQAKIYATFFSVSAAIILCAQFNTPVYNHYLHRTTLDGLLRYQNIQNTALGFIWQRIENIDQNFGWNYFKLILKSFIHYPSDSFKLFSKRFLDSWYTTDSGRFDRILFFTQIIFFVSFVFQWLRQLFISGRNYSVVIFLVLILYMNLVATFTLPICRYMAPVSPIFIFVMVYTFVQMATYVIQKKSLLAKPQ